MSARGHHRWRLLGPRGGGAAVAGALLAVLGIAPAAVAQPDRTVAVTPNTPATWTGATATGHNVTYDPTAGEPCGKTDATYCDVTLVNVVAGDFYATSGGGVEFSIGGSPGNDLDLYVYRSDADGNRGALVGSSAGPTDIENTAIQNADGYFLVQVVYFDVDPAADYQGRAAFFRRAKVPPDVDNPSGLQDHLASNPRLGFRSHSEPHIAQNPLNPNMLVAASKQYNRDPDSLAEYEFKNGSYVSFTRGRNWTDLAQLNVCPQRQAPPASWPLGNDCYPRDNPAREGTGPEDVPPGGDFGEEYITSDPWVDFDDEGNAYAMALDSPPFPSGAGWGMSFHRWDSVSPSDVRRGRTWSDRIPINAYETPQEQQLFLDDKNTFAVNNAGPDRDGKTGIIVACWGQNGPVLPDRGPQQIVCERSTDGGRSWPDKPTPVSPGAQRLVIGVHVVADTQDPNTFYAVWLEYLSGLVDGTGTNAIYLSKTTDGARTWSDATLVQRFLPLPRVFPRQAFRNLTLPIMAVGRNSELYLTYADYNPAPLPGDEDGLQADIKFTKSLDTGQTWSTPVKVNQDTTNADQFQQYIRVTPHGQLNVSFFDRRLDRPDPPRHPGNFFIDTWLARSNDGGTTWTDSRVSHDSWDPSINPPISGSGEFIGDYQGLVVDDCFAIPFVNDTHLANDPRRDPRFDRGYPRSRFQQVFSWLVPNTRAYGGRLADCRDRQPGDYHSRDSGKETYRSAEEQAQKSEQMLANASPAEVRRLAAKHQIITEARP
jgi:hypothetical protein